MQKKSLSKPLKLRFKPIGAITSKPTQKKSPIQIIGSIGAITSKPNPLIHADPNPPSTDPSPPPCPDQTTNPT